MNKKILITGATGAMGFLMSKTLVENQHNVVGTTRSVSGKREAIAKELQSSGIKLIEMDVTDDSSVHQGVEEAVQLLDGIDVVINNAGIGTIGIQEFFSVEDMHKVFDVNVYGVQRVVRAALPHLRKQGQGTVIHISSGIGRLTFPFYGTYCASKYALEAIAESYRAELAGFGIESCIIEPGAMPTEFLDVMLQLQPKDESRSQAYGDLIHVPQAAMEGLQQALQANPNQDPQKVADAIVNLLAMPFGKKPFRTVVDYTFLKEPVEAYNTLLHDITRKLYVANGMEEMLNLNQ
ncbi:MAG: SDR family oxidoreductase [Calditrichae bacterium]|nr:SDR family oxidoreductase [Calditrichota bacterium]MCB9057479.1 SDR family oxidoreductase [Calditrichia bacterium]